MAYDNYDLEDGKVKIQIEDLLPRRSVGGWVYQKPGTGIANAEGASYYYKTNDKVMTHHFVPDNGRFGFTLDVEEAGTYQILLRAARATNDDPKHRNDIWIQIDGDTAELMPKGTPPLTEDHGGKGFVKFKGAQTNWVNAHMFSAEGANPESTVVLDEGKHTFVFAPRSTGYHIDSIQVVQRSVIDDPDDPTPGTLFANISARTDDFETNKLGASMDLDLGRDGKGAQSVGLRFTGMDLDKSAEIEKAYFVFRASEKSGGNASFRIEIQDGMHARTYSSSNTPDDRSYVDDVVVWNPGDWAYRKMYMSPDISDLIESVIGNGGIDAEDALAFRITGSGQRVAYAFESGELAPQLVIEYA